MLRYRTELDVGFRAQIKTVQRVVTRSRKRAIGARSSVKHYPTMHHHKKLCPRSFSELEVNGSTELVEALNYQG